MKNDETPFKPTPHDHRRFFEEDRQPAEIHSDNWHRAVPIDNATGLRFSPHMSILAAARIAGERGLLLACEWSKLGGLKVTTTPKVPPPYLRAVK
jgi:hypothetical protein